jgi:uncharacterized protein YggU (UPF0235/DUF167 family)
VARDGLRVAIRVSPGARTDRLIEIAVGVEGRRVLRAAEGGRANEALMRLLARAWDLPRRDLSIVAGAAGRNKTVRMAGDAQRLMDKIRPAIAAMPGW